MADERVTYEWNSRNRSTLRSRIPGPGQDSELRSLAGEPLSRSIPPPEPDDPVQLPAATHSLKSQPLYRRY